MNFLSCHLVSQMRLPHQGFMNCIFNPFLRKFVMVFFDDILIYRNSWEGHVQHVDRVLQLLKEKERYEKNLKIFPWDKGGRLFGSYCISLRCQGGP